MKNAITPNLSGKRRLDWGNLLVALLLIITLAFGGYLRLAGVNWDEDQHMHPDERFLSLVQVSISPVDGLKDYFNTEESSLNPANRGHTFFVYGTLPIFITRYLGEWLGQTDYNAITLLGRKLSAVFDIITILLIFAIGQKLYRKWVGLLAAVFYALAVLPIQLAHYATVDSATNTFAFIAVFAAVWGLTRMRKTAKVGEISDLQNEDTQEDSDDTNSTNAKKVNEVLRDLAPYILFGMGLGAAAASKINAVVFAMILPLVEGMRYLKLDQKDRPTEMGKIIRNLVVGAVVSFLVFRIGQPYAFNGPGFFNMGINVNWWTSLQNLRVQASGAVDFPPALQWARRPITFSWKNLVAYGLGWPLGITAWIAYIVMGWHIFKKRNWHTHLPLWLFTGLYFIWQSFSWVRSMRYQVLIYPLLALFAGWWLERFISAKKGTKHNLIKSNPKILRGIGIVLLVIVIMTTGLWAFSFSRIYVRPHTRVEASRWIYQNIPGALNLEMETEEGQYQHPLPYRASDTMNAKNPFSMPFYGVKDGTLQAVTFPKIVSETNTAVNQQIVLTIVSADDLETPLASSVVEGVFQVTETAAGSAAYTFSINPALPIEKCALYYIQLRSFGSESSLVLSGSPSLELQTDDGMELTTMLPRILQSVQVGRPYTMDVQIQKTGTIQKVSVPFLVDLAGDDLEKDLTISLQVSNQEQAVSTGILKGAFLPGVDVRGSSAEFVLDKPLYVEKGAILRVSLMTKSEGSRLVPHGAAPVHESSWDDAVPYPVDGFSPYSESGGIYRGDLNFEMYWADDALKLKKFETLLDQADYIFITSNRQWGTTTRVPERYLLTTKYYRELLGCPADQDVTWCYSVAEPGMFEGNLGFELVQTFDSNPQIGPIEINTQFAEEAFTVYDHPKVLIFKKIESYDPISTREILRSVDLSKVVYFTPGEAANYTGPEPEQLDEPEYNLMLPEERLDSQRAGGTWSELFDREDLINTSQPLAAVIFYLFVFALGVLFYPLVRIALPGLPDKGYPLSKLAGLLMMAFLVWILGSVGVPITRLTILFVLLGLLMLSIVLVILQKDTLLEELKQNWRYFLVVEVLALLAFVFFILIRLGNPDLWHPYKGGEKPMDFSYLNAVIKSTTFPPYDPWFAGGYINYYYYGFVIVGVPIKLLGIVPAIAYNIVLPIWYSLLILGAFSVGWNLYKVIPRSKALSSDASNKQHKQGMALWVGLLTAIILAVLGNLGTVRLIISGFQRIASGTALVEDAGFGQRIAWAFQGFTQFLKGTPMPFYPGDWYWIPSRVIPGEAITEFPYFTFIYADLHAHLIALPITILAISWSLSVVTSKARWVTTSGKLHWLRTVIGITFGALVIGALRPTNTWDFYTYIVLAVIALFYSILRYYQPRLKMNFKGSDWLEKVTLAVLISLGFVLLAMVLYQPFTQWFGQAYNQIGLWKGDRTPLRSYFTHWGLFLFIISSWMAWDTYHWMKTTPASALKKLDPYRVKIFGGIVLFLVVLMFLLFQGVVIALVALPLGLWTVILMFRPGSSDSRRFHLFMIGTAFALTLAVELMYVEGDIGRMNTVFKFYLQAWILFALSAGVCLGWLVKSIRYWKKHLILIWQVILFILVVSAALFTLMGTSDKIRDRMAPDAPKSLDGMAYMPYATYYDLGAEMRLLEDYQAILWMQENIKGSPVILEGQAYEYRWGNRFTIYTGLPGVVGWNWHQRQQRAVLRNNSVQERVDAVNAFYTTEDITYVVDFIEQFDVSFIVVGQLERIFYPGVGLEKFEALDGKLWAEVFRVKDTVIYQVMP